MTSSRRARRRRREASKKARNQLAIRSQATADDPIVVRAMELPLTIDKADRSVEVVAATESPVREFDNSTGEMWPTVLLIDGARINDQQIPLLDDHDRFSVRSQIGSARDPRKAADPKLGPVLTYRAFVSSAEEPIWTKIAEGHLRRVSVGRLDGDLQPRTFAPPIYIPSGQSRDIAGRTFTGPLRVIPDWEPKEVSFTVLNADGRASVRSANGVTQPQKDLSTMNPKLKQMLVTRGLEQNATDADARAFCRGILATRNEKLTTDEAAIESLEKADAEKQAADAAAAGAGQAGHAHHHHTAPGQQGAGQAAGGATAGAGTPGTSAAAPGADGAAANRSQDAELVLRGERDRVLNIRACGELQGVPSAIIDELIDRGASFGDATKRIREYRAQQGENRPVHTLGNVTVTRNEFDKVGSQITEGLVVRAFGGDVKRALGPDKKISNEAGRWSQMTLLQIAERTLQAHGVTTDGLGSVEIAERSIRMNSDGLGLATRSENAFVAPSTLPGFLLDVGNRVLLMGFQEANTRWREWVRIGDPVNDFRPVAMYAGDEGGLLDLVPDDEEFHEDKTAQLKETTSAELYGKSISFTYRSIVNDDLGFLTQRLSKRGRMADRTINRACLAVLTGNPTLANDSIALFDSGTHKNIVGSGGAPSVSQLGLMRNLLRQQTGLNGANIRLNLTMKNLIVPSALESAAEVVVYTRIDPGATNNEKYNPFGNKVSLIVEPDLDDTSAVVYYGVTDFRDHDFIVIRFMRGQENPILGETFNQKRLSRDYTVYQTWAGPTPVDYRGAVKNPGQ